ncbi:MAG: hypothetical protein ABI266_08835 [Ginsengibacter sp.]
MKKVFLTAFVGLLTAGAFAQTITPAVTSTAAMTAANGDRYKDFKSLDNEVIADAHAKELRRKDWANHDYTDAAKETAIINKDKKEIHANVKDLKKDGVKDPFEIIAHVDNVKGLRENERRDRKMRRYDLKHHLDSQATAETAKIALDAKGIKVDEKNIRIDLKEHPVVHHTSHIHAQRVKGK